MSGQIEQVVEERILRLRIDRPEKKNALTQAMYGALADGIEAADGDDGVRAVLITGAGDAFTAGNDIADFLAAPRFDTSSPTMRFLRAIAHARKPLVAAVRGAAIGVGTTMLLHCDLVYAATDARFQLPFVRLALVPEAASSLLLPRLVGYQRAAELLLLGEPFDASAAREMGLVNHVVEPEALEPAALDAARRLASLPPEALRRTRALLKRATRDAVDETMAAEAAEFVTRLGSPEAREAMEAFMERRAPDFSRFS